MSSSTLLWRQLKVAFLPLIAAIVCFVVVVHREEFIYAWMGGMILSILVAVTMIKLAGLPLEIKKNRPPIRTLHPVPNARHGGNQVM